MVATPRQRSIAIIRQMRSARPDIRQQAYATAEAKLADPSYYAAHATEVRIAMTTSRAGQHAGRGPAGYRPREREPAPPTVTPPVTPPVAEKVEKKEIFKSPEIEELFRIAKPGRVTTPEEFMRVTAATARKRRISEIKEEVERGLTREQISSAIEGIRTAQRIGLKEEESQLKVVVSASREIQKRGEALSIEGERIAREREEVEQAIATKPTAGETSRLVKNYNARVQAYNKKAKEINVEARLQEMKYESLSKRIEKRRESAILGMAEYVPPREDVPQLFGVTKEEAITERERYSALFTPPQPTEAEAKRIREEFPPALHAPALHLAGSRRAAEEALVGTRELMKKYFGYVPAPVREAPALGMAGITGAVELFGLGTAARAVAFSFEKGLKPIVGEERLFLPTTPVGKEIVQVTGAEAWLKEFGLVTPTVKKVKGAPEYGWTVGRHEVATAAELASYYAVPKGMVKVGKAIMRVPKEFKAVAPKPRAKVVTWPAEKPIRLKPTKVKTFDIKVIPAKKVKLPEHKKWLGYYVRKEAFKVPTMEEVFAQLKEIEISKFRQKTIETKMRRLQEAQAKEAFKVMFAKERRIPRKELKPLPAAMRERIAAYKPKPLRPVKKVKRLTAEEAEMFAKSMSPQEANRLWGRLIAAESKEIKIREAKQAKAMKDTSRMFKPEQEVAMQTIDKYLKSTRKDAKKIIFKEFKEPKVKRAKVKLMGQRQLQIQLTKQRTKASAKFAKAVKTRQKQAVLFRQPEAAVVLAQAARQRGAIREGEMFMLGERQKEKAALAALSKLGLRYGVAYKTRLGYRVKTAEAIKAAEAMKATKALRAAEALRPKQALRFAEKYGAPTITRTVGKAVRVIRKKPIWWPDEDPMRMTQKILERKEPGYDAYVKRKRAKLGKKKYKGRGFAKVNTKPLTKKAAKGLAAKLVDTYTNRSFTIRPAGKPAQPSFFGMQWEALRGKFRERKSKRKDVGRFVEKSAHAIDSWQEKQGIPYEAARQRRALAFKGIRKPNRTKEEKRIMKALGY